MDEHDVRHLPWLDARLGNQLPDASVITTGPPAYQRSDGTGGVPASLLAP